MALVAVGMASPLRTHAPAIPWTRLHNPILRYPDRAVKDPALMWAGGRWHALFGAVDREGHWAIGISTSADLHGWSAPTVVPHDPALEGEASPDVARAPDGSYVVTYQSFVHDAGGAAPKLYTRTTTDFRSFSPPRALGRELHPGPDDRMIDAALAWTPAGLLLAYKYGAADGKQAFELARSVTGTLDGPWTLVGRPDITLYDNTIENYQFLRLEGRWRLLATSNAFDRPYLFDLVGKPRDPRSWLEWSHGRRLRIPIEPWNRGRGLTGVTYEHANSAYLIDGRAIGGRYYLVYADSPEITTFGGAGHAQLGVARSRDLEHWSVPPR